MGMSPENSAALQVNDNLITSAPCLLCKTAASKYCSDRFQMGAIP